MIPDPREIQALEQCANVVRRHIVEMIANAGAGHPGGSLSATDVIVCLFFKLMHVDPSRPGWPQRDRFVLSKGHAAPALYAALAERGFFSKEHLMTFDHVDSILQGHPDMNMTPGVDISTGSLGQGLSAGVGMALGARLRQADFHTYVMLGDGELQEGQIWEAAMLGAKHRLDNLTAIVDDNSLQLADKTAVIMPSCEPYEEKWSAFGWNVLNMDGHDIAAILTVLDEARRHSGTPTVVIPHTVKGKGVSFMEHNVAWHSRGLTPDELTQALRDLDEESSSVGELQAMRDAFGEAFVALARQNPDIVALDADLAPATKFSAFAAAFPERFFQVGVAEQNMAGVAAGLATVGFIPFVSTFACFASCRIADQVRTSIAQPGLPVKLIAPYSGLLTGQTGKTHQAIEDIALYRGMPGITIVAPADGPETTLAVRAIADHPSPVYLRLTRDPAPVVFDLEHPFEIGRAYRLREGDALTLISTGSMTPTALEAAGYLSLQGVETTVLHVPTIKPLAVDAVVEAARATGRVLTLEEHNVYAGFGGAVAEVLSEYYPVPVFRLGIRDTFGESGSNEALLEKYGLTAPHVVQKAREWISR